MGNPTIIMDTDITDDKMLALIAGGMCSSTAHVTCDDLGCSECCLELEDGKLVRPEEFNEFLNKFNYKEE